MLYSILMSVLSLDGVSSTKIIVTLLPWLAFFLSLYYYRRNYRQIKSRIPPVAFGLFNVLLITNLVNVARSLADASATITTAFGNPYNALALLTPFALGFGVTPRLLAELNRFFRYFVWFGGPLYLGLLVAGLVENPIYKIAGSLASPTVFLIPFIPYAGRLNRLLIIILSAASFVSTGLITGSRATVLRYPLVYFGTLIANLGESRIKLIRNLGMGLTLLPVALLAISINLGQSIFEVGSQELRALADPKSQAGILEKADTRTLLYSDIYDDYSASNDLIFGRGSSGTYFSRYFLLSKADSATRLTVEVGVLAILMKGGLFAVLLNYFIFAITVYHALAQSNNKYVRSIGLYLGVHILLLFAENLLAFDLYNFTVWFMVGVCLSRELRGLSDWEMEALLTGKSATLSPESSAAPYHKPLWVKNKYV